METLSWISFQYDTLINSADPRIKDWPFADGPVKPALILSAYFLFIYLGPKWMANRKPLVLKPVLIVYNFSMVISNAYLVKEMLLGGWLYEYTLGCQPVDYSNNPTALRMVKACWLFFVTRNIELLDTVFFILRKKNEQLTFLHVFHHGGIPLFWWFCGRLAPGGFGTFHLLINAFVHVVMYVYYGLAILGPRVQKYLWWKRYVTILQLTQFFIVTLHNAQYLFIECSYPAFYVALIQVFTTIVGSLFLNFYIQTYLKQASPRRITNNSGQAQEAGRMHDYKGRGHLNGIEQEAKYRSVKR